jgi:hypothetical protein
VAVSTAGGHGPLYRWRRLSLMSQRPSIMKKIMMNRMETQPPEGASAYCWSNFSSLRPQREQDQSACARART